jgi:hypothetical protein
MREFTITSEPVVKSNDEPLVLAIEHVAEPFIISAPTTRLLTFVALTSIVIFRGDVEVDWLVAPPNCLADDANAVVGAAMRSIERRQAATRFDRRTRTTVSRVRLRRAMT